MKKMKRKIPKMIWFVTLNLLSGISLSLVCLLCCEPEVYFLSDIIYAFSLLQNKNDDFDYQDNQTTIEDCKNIFKGKDFIMESAAITKVKMLVITKIYFSIKGTL